MVIKMYPLWLIHRYRGRPWEEPHRSRGSSSRLPRGTSHLHPDNVPVGSSPNLPFLAGREA